MIMRYAIYVLKWRRLILSYSYLELGLYYFGII